ncbi:MAG: S8 family serine peptidase [Elusimicrobia bacterium]|nr:S8 family serine peptidase [Candidatus Obscuribacterium magneticum]
MRSLKRFLLVGLLFGFACPALGLAADPYVPHQVLVRLKSTPSVSREGMAASEFGRLSADVQSLLSTVKALHVRPLLFDTQPSEVPFRIRGQAANQYQWARLRSALERTVVVTLEEDVTVEEAIKKLRRDPQVEICEPNYLRRPSRTANDTSYAQLWALQNTGQAGNLTDYDPAAGVAGRDIDAEAAWDTVTGSATVIVAVVDSGADLDHPDLAANLMSGRDFVLNNSNPNDDCAAASGHGTHVAGIIGAVGNNGAGVTGVGWNVRLMPLKVADASLGCLYPDSAIADAIDYAVTNGADIINMSFGGDNDNAAMRTSIEAAVAAGVVMVAAAGNESTSALRYPAANAGVLAVAATDRTDRVAPFSNYGSYVDLAAPGVAIYSTIPDNTYIFMNGTSMASPMVAGVAALVLSEYPSLSASEITTRILQSCENIDAYNPAYVGQIGAGRVNAARALLGITSVSPAAGIRDSPATLTLNGVSFMDPMRVQLTRTGENPVTATGVTWASRTSLSCTMDLTGAATGLWNVTVSTDQTSQSLANAFTVESIVLTSMAPSSATNVGTTGIVTLTGNNFADSMTIRLVKTGETDIIGTGLTLQSVTQATVTFNVDGVDGGRWDILMTKGTAEYRLSRFFLITSDAFQVFGVDPAADYTLTVNAAQGAQSVTWPQGTLNQAAVLDLDGSPILPSVDATRDPYVATGIGMEILSTPSTVVFNKAFTVTLPYRLSDLSDPYNERALTMARYDATTGRWGPLPSIIDTQVKTVSAAVDHLSFFAVLQHVPSLDLKKIVAFPNPFRSDRGHARVVFDFLTAGSRVRIYDISGQSICDLRDDNDDGQIIWLVTNDSGGKVASGVYYYLVTDPQGNRETGRVGIIR